MQKIAKWVSPALILVFLSGCLMWDPGGQVRRAADHRSQWGWNHEGNFTADAQGPQTHTFRMKEEMEAYDGAGNVIQRTIYSLESEPSIAPTEGAFQNSTAQVELLGPSAIRAIETIVMEFLKRMPPVTDPLEGPIP